MDISTNIHDVRKIKIKDVHYLENTGAWVRDIVLATRKGRMEIVAFADDQDGLVVETSREKALAEKLSEVLDHWQTGTDPDRYAPLVSDCRALIEVLS